MTFRLLCAASTEAEARVKANTPIRPRQILIVFFLSGCVSRLVASVHDRLRQMMWPGGGVVVRPKPRVNLRNDDPLVRRTKLINLFGKQSRRVQAMSANLDFPAGITRNQLVR